MDPNGPSTSWEEIQDILDFLECAGYPVTREQIARLQRRELIDTPRKAAPNSRVSTWYFPPGTADRLVRISQLRKFTKQFDELAWRLWWEGATVPMHLVRAYLLRRFARWDELSRESRRVPPSADPPSVGASRDVLEEVFFQHLKTGAVSTSARRQLERDIERHAAIAEIFMIAQELAEGRVIDPVAHSSGVEESREQPLPRPIRSTILAQFDASFSDLVPALDDEVLDRSRNVAIALLVFGAEVGTIIGPLNGVPPRSRDSFTRALLGATKSSDEQVLSLVLASRLLTSGDGVLPVAMTEKFVPYDIPISFGEYRMLIGLAESNPDLEPFVHPNQVAALFTSVDRLDSWRERLEEAAVVHPELLTSPSEKADGEGLDAPPMEEGWLVQHEINEQLGLILKKKILNDLWQRPHR